MTLLSCLIQIQFIYLIFFCENAVYSNIIQAKFSWLPTLFKRSGEKSRITISISSSNPPTPKNGHNGNRLIDLNCSPPSSPTSLPNQNIQTPQIQLSSISQQSTKRRKGNTSKYTPEERIRAMKEQSSQSKKKYNLDSIDQAKKQLQGEELNEYLHKAHQSRLRKREKDLRSRDQMAQRFRSGLQTPQDEKKRMQGIERARRFREKKKKAKEGID